MLAVRLPKNLEDRLSRLSLKTNRTKSFYVKKALEKILEEEEDYADALASYEDYLRSGQKGISLDEMKKRYGSE
jgi:RHH-type rel operon transcriptional repressor/antitoxin RelB